MKKKETHEVLTSLEITSSFSGHNPFADDISAQVDVLLFCKRDLSTFFKTQNQKGNSFCVPTTPPKHVFAVCGYKTLVTQRSLDKNTKRCLSQGFE